MKNNETELAKVFVNSLVFFREGRNPANLPHDRLYIVISVKDNTVELHGVGMVPMEDIRAPTSEEVNLVSHKVEKDGSLTPVFGKTPFVYNPTSVFQIQSAQ